jgi:hypothetical protein
VQTVDEIRTLVEEVRQMIADIDRAEFYEVDSEGDRVLTRKKISERVALAIAAGAGGPKTPDGFAEILLAHVCDAEPDYLVLESACRQIEGSEKYVAVPAEFLKAIKQQKELWEQRYEALTNAVGATEYAIECLAEAHAEYKIERAEVKVAEAKREWERWAYLVSRIENDVVKLQDEAHKLQQQIEFKQSDAAKQRIGREAAATKLREAEEALAKLKAAGDA